MDRLSQLRGEAGSSRDSTLDTTSPPSEAFMTANESSSKFYSLSEVDSTFDISSMKDDISSIKDVSLASTSSEAGGTMTNTEELMSNLSPIGKKSDILDSYKIDTQIEAANILSGGVAIFDENSYDGNELVIDDNVEVDEKSNPEMKQSESLQFKTDDNIIENALLTEETDIASKDTEVLLQIDGKNVDAIDIGNGLYLYRKGQEELAAVQIIDDDLQQPSFKFLKVRENTEGNLEVYEEIEVEVPKEVPAKDVKTDKGTLPHLPIKDINKVINESSCNKVADKQNKIIKKEPVKNIVVQTENKEMLPESKTEVNLNGKMMKLSESRKSPVIGTFTPMTYHSTPKKEGIPLTKTMVDQQLHPNRHSDVFNVKKTIEVHTDNCKRTIEPLLKCKDIDNDTKVNETFTADKEIITTDKETTSIEPCNENMADKNDFIKANTKESSIVASEITELDEVNVGKVTKDEVETIQNVPLEQENANDSTEKKVAIAKVEESAQSDIEVEKVDENIILTDTGVPVIDKVKELPDDTTKVFEGDIEPEITKVKAYLCGKEGESIHKHDSQIEQVEPKKVENTVTDANAPILIEDDDISIVEVVVDNKDENDENICDNKNENDENNKCEVQVDKNNKDNSIISGSITTHGKENIEIKAMIEESNDVAYKTTPCADSTKTNPMIDPQLKSGAETFSTHDEQENNRLVISEPSDIKKDVIILPIQNNTTEEVTTSSPAEIVNKDMVRQGNEDILVISIASINDPKQTTLHSNVSDDIQNNKPLELTERKNAAIKDGTIKHVISANISPLLEQKQQTIFPSRVNAVKSKLPEKNEDKKLSSINDVLKINKVVEHVTENNLHELQSRNASLIAPLVTRPTPITTEIQISSRTVPPQVSTKNSAHKIVGSGAELRKNIIPLPIKNVTVDKPRSALDIKASFTSQRDDKSDIKVPPKVNSREKATCVMNIEISKVPKLESVKITALSKQTDHNAVSKVTNPGLKNKIEPKDKKDNSKMSESKPINNNHTAVPFGKWTEANRQEFLNKFKTKTSVTSSNSNQLKNSNDLNRRDVLKKIDSQRQSSTALSKSQEAGKHSMKSETSAFSNKPTILTKDTIQGSKTMQKSEISEVEPKAGVSLNITNIEVVPNYQNEPQAITVTGLSKTEICQTKGNVQNLIDKTIEGMIHRKTKEQNAPKQNVKESNIPKPTENKNQHPTRDTKLDEIEMKMNELHGIPFIERPAHELPQVHKPEPKTYSVTEKEKPAVPVKPKIPKLLPYSNKNQQKGNKESVIEVDSEEEIIEHEPITGDIDLIKKNKAVIPPAKEKLPALLEKSGLDASVKEQIITEKDFDKFARRNSITYENRLTVNFDSKEPHNVVQTVVAKEVNTKNYSKNDTVCLDSKTNLPYKQQFLLANTQSAVLVNTQTPILPNTQATVQQPVTKLGPTPDDASNRNQSKLQKAYYSALTEKRQLDSEYPITIIEDKPVKVLFVNNVETAPTQLNVQGQDLSPARNPITDSDVTVNTNETLDSDLLDSSDDVRSQDDVRTKSKHQRKQVLTPVEEPELELIEPRDLGIVVSPKKKRRTDDDKIDKTLKYPMRKKYLLTSSSLTEEKVSNPTEIVKNTLKESVNLNDDGVIHNPVSALDSLVKAAELIETQTENMNNSTVSSVDSQLNTPVKRGRGRPRKYPITPDGTVDKSKPPSPQKKPPSPQKKPRLLDALKPKQDVSTDESDSDGEIIKENWTMGKINENIVCPICNKLFRTENVVFKHVKHCTGPSPNRSDSDKRSPRRMRISQDSDSKSQSSKSDDMDIDDDKPLITQKLNPKKRKSKDSRSKSVDKDDVIIIEDTPVKEPVKGEERKTHVSRKLSTKIPLKNNDLVCEFCGKTFRQLSYLVSHKLQHKKTEKVEPKNTEKIQKDALTANKHTCEVCKKVFRKLHHLVQHRIIHNPSSVSARSSRKSSSEKLDGIVEKEPSTSKQNEDPSAGFRCEPCDKSFRKLHHLVEHRETHDGINRQKTSTAQPNKEEKIERPIIIHQCDFCKKTFKKLAQLNEHKEQHTETSSEKSDDKSVKSSLSTKDIIHECSLCYMVFPNEHSLNKHTVICQRKKRQSKQPKPTGETEGGEEVIERLTPEEKVEITDSPKAQVNEIEIEEEAKKINEKVELAKDRLVEKELSNIIEAKTIIEDKDKTSEKVEGTVTESQAPPAKRDLVIIESSNVEAVPVVPEKTKRLEHKEPTKVLETPKKKTVTKDKTPNVSKRSKPSTSTTATEETKPAEESSDDEEIRYMLNPNFKVEEVTEEKVFMKVRANKRSSLQIERPDSKDLMKRRTSLQHPPKIPRLKSKAVENNVVVKKEVKTPKVEPLPSTDSDDSETTKYSFPLTIPEKSTKPPQNRTPKNSGRKGQKKSLIDKRKSLSGVAKRKSLGKMVTAKHKLTPLKEIKKRLDAEHRCDCGQLFSSAALLSRHTTLAHTPPRIRRKRSPPPAEKPLAKDKPAPRKSTEKSKPLPTAKKPGVRNMSSAPSTTKPTKSQSEKKSKKSDEESNLKRRRTGAHRGVPVPEKMKKIMEKL